jgi:hypothetical protein
MRRSRWLLHVGVCLAVVGLFALGAAQRVDLWTNHFCSAVGVLGADGQPVPDEDQPMTRCLREVEQRQSQARQRQRALYGLGLAAQLLATSLGVAVILPRRVNRRRPAPATP